MRASLRHGDRVIGYLDTGVCGGSPSKGTLVLLHAFPLAADMWQPQLAAVPPGWRIIAPDLRGFGRSSPGSQTGPPSMDDYAEDVVVLLDHLALERAVIGGLSMGGYAAFAVLRSAPARVAALVLADTRAEADDETAKLGRDAMADTLARGGAAAVFERMAPNLLGTSTQASRPDVVETVRTLVLAQPVDGIRGAIHRLKSRRDSSGLLAAIACPTLVIVGKEDRITGVEVAQAMHRRIPGSQCAVIDRAGHLSNLEQPEAFNEALTAFLTTLSAGSRQ